MNKITLYFEFYDHDLNKELIKRRDKNVHNKFKLFIGAFYKGRNMVFIRFINRCMLLFWKNKIFHGDLRPINILLTQDGYVKIADHGIL